MIRTFCSGCSEYSATGRVFDTYWSANYSEGVIGDEGSTHLIAFYNKVIRARVPALKYETGVVYSLS